MTVQNRRIFASILFVLISFVCFSQTGGEKLPPVPGTPGGPVGPPGFPIDGGVILGVIFALCYGAKKLLFQNPNK
ncbi:hypothetical protein [Seonamhaeicola marinus]|uniref:Uncharacterized protein n=1 Tax=Seonamhaeicola marinus TaxID=1912246 RepID=A0A5D0HSC4_9FLAO|nr:hypothetical protein [Seonamhaeicola marinus]TYA74244.1 hypothetical protein FUA24_13000 [Seonamhaeicola marinus]